MILLQNDDPDKSQKLFGFSEVHVAFPELRSQVFYYFSESICIMMSINFSLLCFLII